MKVCSPMTAKALNEPLGYDLKTPCESCPFRMDKPLGRYAGNYGLMIMDFMFHGLENSSHSCHKTDPRTDYPKPKRMNGKIQHCAGFVIMATKSKIRVPANTFLSKKDLNMKAPVGTFYKWLGKVARELREQGKP